MKTQDKQLCNEICKAFETYRKAVHSNRIKLAKQKKKSLNDNQQ